MKVGRTYRTYNYVVGEVVRMISDYEWGDMIIQKGELFTISRLGKDGRMWVKPEGEQFRFAVGRFSVGRHHLNSDLPYAMLERAHDDYVVGDVPNIIKFGYRKGDKVRIINTKLFDGRLGDIAIGAIYTVTGTAPCGSIRLNTPVNRELDIDDYLAIEKVAQEPSVDTGSDNDIVASIKPEDKEQSASVHHIVNDVWNFGKNNLNKQKVIGFHQMSALKYLACYDVKHTDNAPQITDLKKAKASIGAIIKLIEKEQVN